MSSMFRIVWIVASLLMAVCIATRTAEKRAMKALALIHKAQADETVFMNSTETASVEIASPTTAYSEKPTNVSFQIPAGGQEFDKKKAVLQVGEWEAEAGVSIYRALLNDTDTKSKSNLVTGNYYSQKRFSIDRIHVFEDSGDVYGHSTDPDGWVFLYGTKEKVVVTRELTPPATSFKFSSFEIWTVEEPVEVYERSNPNGPVINTIAPDTVLRVVEIGVHDVVHVYGRIESGWVFLVNTRSGWRSCMKLTHRCQGEIPGQSAELKNIVDSKCTLPIGTEEWEVEEALSVYPEPLEKGRSKGGLNVKQKILVNAIKTEGALGEYVYGLIKKPFGGWVFLCNTRSGTKSCKKTKGKSQGTMILGQSESLEEEIDLKCSR